MSIVLFGVVITRLTFLWFGYGSDPDAWRVADVADKLWHNRHYEVSRFPGYPLHEIITAPLVALGQNLHPDARAIFSNGGTLVATLVLILVWGRIVNRVSHRPQHLIVALAFTPLLWYNSAATMDYVWSLLFLTLALNAAQQQRSISAGVWLGIAAGFRPSNIVAVAPLLTVFVLNRSSSRTLLQFLVASFLATVAAFLPILLTYGLGGWTEGILSQMKGIPALSLADRTMFLVYRSVYAIGPLASIVAVGVLFMNRKDIIPQLRGRDPIMITAWVGLSAFFLLFFLHPFDRSYLLPALPFLLLLVERIASSRAFALFLACLVLHGFVNIDIVKHEGARGKPAFNVHAGLVVEEMLAKITMMNDRTVVARLDVQGNAIVMTGTGASFWFQNDDVEVDTSAAWRDFNDPVARRRSEHDVRFIPLLTKDELARVRLAGCKVYCLEKQRAYIESVAGYTMEQEGIPILAQNANKL